MADRKTRKRRETPDPASNQQDFPQRVGRRIRALREANLLVLEEAAQKAEMSPGALSEIENGKRWRTRFFDLNRLAKAIGCKPADFFDDET